LLADDADLKQETATKTKAAVAAAAAETAAETILLGERCSCL
jgi:hypothetical protein